MIRRRHPSFIVSILFDIVPVPYNTIPYLCYITVVYALSNAILTYIHTHIQGTHHYDEVGCDRIHGCSDVSTATSPVTCVSPLTSSSPPSYSILARVIYIYIQYIQYLISLVELASFAVSSYV